MMDVFGTVVDWKTSVTEEVRKRVRDAGLEVSGDIDVDAFVLEWRQGYMSTSKAIAGGGTGPSSVDVMHRQLLEKMLASPKWEALGAVWSQDARDDLSMVWHRLSGWKDSSEGLRLLKKETIVGALSNGNIALLVDLSKYADLTWDVVLSAELFGTYKPNGSVYLGAAHHLSLKPSECAMVATHVWDLRGAAAQGMRTVYVRRPEEGIRSDDDKNVKAKKDGGEVDVVVDSLVELAGLMKA